MTKTEIERVYQSGGEVFSTPTCWCRKPATLRHHLRRVVVAGPNKGKVREWDTYSCDGHPPLMRGVEMTTERI